MISGDLNSKILQKADNTRSWSTVVLQYDWNSNYWLTVQPKKIIPFFFNEREICDSVEWYRKESLGECDVIIFNIFLQGLVLVVNRHDFVICDSRESIQHQNHWILFFWWNTNNYYFWKLLTYFRSGFNTWKLVRAQKNSRKT